VPEMHFEIAFADGRRERCYSPSLIVRELISEGADYPVYEFMARIRAALEIASERVRLKYGFACSAALDQLAQLEALCAALDPSAPVRVLGFSFEHAPAPPAHRR
jgi:uncharacterized repeat protein (TIGR04042 family)